MNAKLDILSICTKNKGWFHENDIISPEYPAKMQYAIESKLHHLLI